MKIEYVSFPPVCVSKGLFTLCSYDTITNKNWILEIGSCEQGLTLKALGGVLVFSTPPPAREVFCSITFEVESFSTRNFVTFSDIICRIRTK